MKKKLICLLLAFAYIMTSMVSFAAVMYAPDGQTVVVPKSEKEEWKAKGWYFVPVITIYSQSGKTAVVDASSLDAWKAVGWKGAPGANPQDIVLVDGVGYYIGMPRSKMGIPDEKLPSVYGFTRYVYGTKTYKNFVVAGVENGEVVSLVVAGPGYIYGGHKAGDVPSRDLSYKYFENMLLDNNDNGVIHTVEIADNEGRTKEYTKETLAGESKLNFHLVNAFRVYHGFEILKWSDKAATAALLHSKDMADNNYFSHKNLQGVTSAVRMKDQGIEWFNCGENIAAGFEDAVKAHDGWINSPGHRASMLRPFYKYLGVGMAQNSNSRYNLYYTQNFYS